MGKKLYKYRAEVTIKDDYDDIDAVMIDLTRALNDFFVEGSVDFIWYAEVKKTGGENTCQIEKRKIEKD